MRDHPPSSRVQLSRAAGWRMPPQTVKADRSSILGNPWVAGDPGRLRIPAGQVRKRMHWDTAPPMDQAMSVEHAVALHASWLRDGDVYLPASLGTTDVIICVDALTELRAEVLDLLTGTMRGHSFACWCKLGTPCHADTLMEIANG